MSASPKLLAHLARLNASPEHREHLARLHADPQAPEWSAKGGRIGGSIVGRKNVESGQLARLNASPEHREQLARVAPLGWAASRVGFKPTRPERVLRAKLPSRFLYGGDNSFGVRTNGHTRYPDFYDPETRECVEVFGDYWHGPKGPNAAKLDTPEQRIAEYAAVGWACRVVWERDAREFVP